MDTEVLTEVPVDLQRLVQMVVRGFYTIEDMLVVDMLIRNICLSEENICDLLKFDRKMLRQRMNTLRADKLLQTKIKMITGEDGKAQREQYYFINYKSFVNVVKYKLDHIRKKLEMEERDQTSRASFLCCACQRTYTDLEADQLLDPLTGQLVCIICKTEVQEDTSKSLRGDCRLQLTRFNEQLEPLFSLLKKVEHIKLSEEFSDPTPQELSNGKKMLARPSKNNNDNRAWSGDASKRHGFQVEGAIDVTIDTGDKDEEREKTKEEPVWLSQTSSVLSGAFTSTTSTGIDDQLTGDGQEINGASATNAVIGSGSSSSSSSSSTVNVKGTDAGATASSTKRSDDNNDVLSLLQAHEPKSKRGGADQNSDSDESVEELPIKRSTLLTSFTYNESSLDGILESDDDDSKDDGDSAPMVSVGGERIPLSAVDNSVIARMTQQEKNLYINAYQEYMAGMEDL
uniref:General transcription factor IIE subunit 1-like n=1 Tax=Hirondellea gigas TaxID=1518452 RepID=A0A2P2I7I8_9CRUS